MPATPFIILALRPRTQRPMTGPFLTGPVIGLPPASYILCCAQAPANIPRIQARSRAAVSGEISSRSSGTEGLCALSHGAITPA